MSKKILFILLALFLALGVSYTGLYAASDTEDKPDFTPGVIQGATPFVFEGATDDTSETSFAITDPTADRTFTFANATSGAVMTSSLTTNGIDAANSVFGTSNNLAFEGATADTFETFITPTDPTADRTFTLPDATSGTLMVSSLATNGIDAANSISGVSNGVLFEGATADAFEATLSPIDPTADATHTLVDKAGTIMEGSAVTALTAGATPTLTIGRGNQAYSDTIVTDNQDQTITFSAGGTVGDRISILFISDGSTNDEVITFDTTLVNSTGTLTLAATTVQRYMVSFLSDGTVWNETGRTGAQT